MVFVGLLAWLAFFDSNDLLSQYRLTTKKHDLEQTKKFYQEKIEEVKQDRVALDDPEQLRRLLGRSIL